jgi:hypothetical protein
MNGQWLQCKKRGRDDDLIARDAQIAKDLRLQRRGKTPKPPAAAAAAKRNIGTKQTNQIKKRNRSPLEGFVVGDDEDDDDVEYSSAEEEFEEDEDSSKVESGPSTERTMSKKKKKKTSAIGMTSSSSDDDDTEVSSPDKKWTTNKPSNGRIVRSKNPYNMAKKRRPEVVVTLLDASSSSDDEELVITPPAIKQRSDDGKQKKRAEKGPVFALDDSSDDDDDSALLFDRKRPAKPRANTKSSNHEEKSPEKDVDESALNGVSGGTKKTMVKPSSAPLFDSTDDDDEHDDDLHCPPKTSKVGKKFTKMKTAKQQQNKETKTRKNKKKKKQKTRLKPEDYDCSDIDEARAIEAAIKESRKDMAMADGEQEEAEEDIIDLVDDSSGGEEDYHGSVVVDAEAQAALSVLETANKLSALILQTMATWSNSAVDGMIVNGALALGQGTGGKKDHTWISAETLKDILPPDIKLADYQLIGVNWMALLHGMKVEVEGNRTYANVNGILADEMGLGTFYHVLLFVKVIAVPLCSHGLLFLVFYPAGKTCQTITFLNWLKHNQKGGQSTRPHLVVAPASVSKPTTKLIIPTGCMCLTPVLSPGSIKLVQ